MPTKTVIPLSPEDSLKLRKNLIPILLFPLIFAGIVYLIFSQVIREDQFSDSHIFTFIFAGFALIFLGIIGYMVWVHVADIKGGVKEKIEGAVTDKRLDIQTSTSHGRSGSRGRSSSRTSTKRYYYVYLDGEEFKMDYRHYSSVKVGDHIVMERAPKSKLILMLEVLETASEEEQIQEETVDAKFLATEMLEKRFTPEDLAALKRIFLADRKRKLIFMVLPAFIVSWFLYTDMWGLLLFLFPIPLILIFQLIGLCRLIMRYSKDKAYGHKKGRTAMLEDKLTITGNKTKGRHTIQTTSGRFTVTAPIYDALNTGDKLVIYLPKFSKKPISIAMLDGEEFYLG